MDGGREARSANEATVGVFAEDLEDRIAKTCVGKLPMSGAWEVGRMGASMDDGRWAHGSELGIVRSDNALSMLCYRHCQFACGRVEQKAEDVLMRVARYRAANILERYARKAWVEARNGVTRGLGEAGTRETARDVQLLLEGVRVVCRGEIESLGNTRVTRRDLEHGGAAGETETQRQKKSGRPGTSTSSGREESIIGGRQLDRYSRTARVDNSVGVCGREVIDTGCARGGLRRGEEWRGALR